MCEVTIFSQKECHAIARFRDEFSMCHPTFKFGLHRKEIRAKRSRTCFDLLNSFKHFPRGSDRTHAA
jgi:hypothetical protein